MNITMKDQYENASMQLLTHNDEDYSNSTLKISCLKSRKILNNKFSNWNDLKFRIVITNNDMEYGSNGSYRSVILDKSEFLTWVLSLSQVINNPDCYKNNIIVKRRLKKTDFVVKFAISEKLNCNAVLIAMVSSQTTFSKIGVNGILFSQMVIQLKNLIDNLLDFEMKFDSSVLMYKNNQNIEYQSNLLEHQKDQNDQILQLLSKVDTSTLKRKDIEKTEDIIDDILDKKTENIIDGIEEKIENKDDVDIFDVEDVTVIDNTSSSNIQTYNSEFIADLNDNMESIELEKLFGMREKDIENPPDVVSRTEDTVLEKFCRINDTGIQIFSKIYTEAQKAFPSMHYSGLQQYFSDILNNTEYSLPCCSEEDKKSLMYLSQHQYYNIVSMFGKDEELTDLIDIPLYYHMTDDYNWQYEEIKNIYDLIAIYVYILKYSQTMKMRITSSSENKTIFTKFFKLIFEPVYMTYIVSIVNKENKNTIVNNIFKHYASLQDIDFFEEWNKKAEEFSVNLPKTENIKKCIEDFLNDAMQLQDVSLEVNHGIFYDKGVVKLPYKNDFNEEHIFDIARMESFVGEDKITKDNMLELIDECKSSVNSKLRSFFMDIFTIKQDSENIEMIDKLIEVKKKNKSFTALYRYVKNYNDDFECKDKLLHYVEKVEEKDICLEKLPKDINIHYIPDNLLVAMNLWKPSIDFRIKQYSNLLLEVKNCWKTKTDIISEYMINNQNDNKLNNTENNIENNSNWDCLFEN